MQTLASSQFDPRSMPTFFERLQQSSRYAGQNIPEFLRTHPVTASRISDTRGRAETYPYKQYPDSLSYQLTKAKIRVLTSTDSADTLNYFQLRATQGTQEQRTVARYGLAMWNLNAQKFNEAETAFQQLSKEYPNQPQYLTALARTALESKNYNTALSRYKNLTEQFPENEAIKLEYITSLLKVGNSKLAQKNLFQLKPKTQQLPIYSQLLAQVYSDLNQPAESHRYLAEYYYATGQTRDAILQIKLAQKSKGLNFQLSSILNERLNFFINQEQEAKRNK
jgi:predicted Zn-dependent protease